MRDRFFKRLIDLSKNKSSEKMKKICDSHLRGMKIKCEDIAQKEDDSVVWIVKLQRSNGSGPEQEYMVARTEDVCPASLLSLIHISEPTRPY